MLTDSKVDEGLKPKPSDGSTTPTSLPQRVFFTFQLFNLPHTKSQTMLLHRSAVGTDGASPALFVLMSEAGGSASDSKSDGVELSAPIQFEVDPTLVRSPLVLDEICTLCV